MQLLPNQSILFWSGGWISKPNEKRVENTAVFETISNTDANFLSLHIDKARKTRGDKQLFKNASEDREPVKHIRITLNKTTLFQFQNK